MLILMRIGTISNEDDTHDTRLDQFAWLKPLEFSTAVAPLPSNGMPFLVKNSYFSCLVVTVTPYLSLINLYLIKTSG